MPAILRKQFLLSTRAWGSLLPDFWKKFFLIILLIFLTPITASADALTRKKIIVLGDYIEYNTKSGDVIVKGSARAFNAEMNITAKNIQANVTENKIFAHGDVIFWQKNEKNTGEFISYDMKTGEGYLKKARVFRGHQIISAEELKFSPQYLEAKNMAFTTDENWDDPDYEITAASMSVKYGEYSEILDMKVKFQGKIIRRIPRQYTDLREKPKIIKHRLGYSKYNGTYGRIHFPYNIRDIRSGNATINYYQRRGSGINLSETLKMGDGHSLNYATSYFDDDRNGTVDSKFNLSYTLRQGKQSAGMKLAWSALRNSRDETNKELSIRADSKGKFTLWGYDLSYDLKYDDRIDLDSEKFKGDDFYSKLERIPELSITLPSSRFKFMSTNLNQRLVLGNYHQSGRNEFRGRKYSLKNSINITPFKGGKNLPFTVRINEDWLTNYYSTGDLMQVGSFRVQLDQTIKKFKNSIRYDKKNVLGDESPFRFDNERERENLSFSTDLNHKSFRLKLFSTSYNFDQKKFGGAYSDIRFTAPRESNNNWSFYMKANYDLKDSKLSEISELDMSLKSLYSQWSLKPRDTFRDYGVTLSARYDAVQDEMQDMNASLNFKLKPITPKAHLTVNTRYDYKRGRFTSRKYDLKYDLHTFDSKLSYNTQDKDIWFEIFLKASPRKPTKLHYDYEKKRLKPVLRKYDI